MQRFFCLILMERWWIPLPAVERAWSNWARRHGLAPEEVLAFIHGKQAITSLRHFMAGKSEADIAAEFTRLEQIEATETEGITALPGAIALLSHLNKAGIPWAIVTSGSMPVARARHKNSWASRTRGVCNR